MKRKMIILLAALCFALTGNAQKKTIEHNFYLGVGVANMMEGWRLLCFVCGLWIELLSVIPLVSHVWCRLSWPIWESI